jgi:glycosyltransferase involved in cell wall biosynthesis
MKFALLTHKFAPPMIGGVDVYTDRLGRALQRGGHEVIYLAFDGSGTGSPHAVPRADHHGAPVFGLEFNFKCVDKIRRDSLYDPDMANWCKKVLHEEQVEVVVIMNFYMISAAVIEAAYALELGIVHIATDFLPICRRGTYMRFDLEPCQVGESIRSCATCYSSRRRSGAFASRWLEKLPEAALVSQAKAVRDNSAGPFSRLIQPYLYNVDVMVSRIGHLASLRPMIDLVFAPTRFTRDVFIQNGFNENQLKQLAFGVETESAMASVTPATNDKPHFVFVGRLQPYKGLHTVVEAWQHWMPAGEAKLVVYGSADRHDHYASELLKVIDAHPDMSFRGRVPPEELPQVFGEADVFLLPSTWHENLPLILLDALQSRTPVLASDIAGVCDVILEGENGWLFPPGEVAALGTLLADLADNPEQIDRRAKSTPLVDIDDYARELTESIGARMNEKARAKP